MHFCRLEKLVIIPTYNEKENISGVIHAILSLDKCYHVLVIDDNSPDRTADIVKELIPLYSGKLFLEKREKNNKTKTHLQSMLLL